MFSRALVFSVLLTLLATFDGNPPRAARDSAASLAGAPVEKGLEIPAGTILPAKLDETLKVGAAKPGETLEARIMQEVPLPGEAKIAFRSIITGSVISAESDADGAGVSLTLRFDH